MKDLISGFHAVEAALQAGEVDELLVAQGRRDRRVQKLLALAERQQVRVVQLPRRLLDERAGGAHQGVAARPGSGASEPGDEGDLEQLLDAAEAPPLLLILEGVTDPRNLGACMRSAEAAGALAVVVPRSRTAPLTAVARKAASGAAERLPLIAVANLARTLRWLQQRGIWRYGFAGEARTTLWQAQLDGGCALLFGAEGDGLRRLTREHCDDLLRIPMADAAESLNVSVAAGVALFEARRQRALAQPGPTP